MEILIIGLVLYLLSKNKNGSGSKYSGFRMVKDPITGLWKKVKVERD